MKVLSKKEIIEEEVNFYSVTSRRAIREGIARYYDVETHKKCAVGRCLIDAEKQSNNALNIKQWFNDESFLAQYRGHSPSFWRAIQRLHDNDLCWDNDGLTEYGKLMVKNMKKEWS